MEEYQKRNVRQSVISYKYIHILHGMAWYAIAWHDISVSLSSVSNCLILSCLELCCVVLSCAVPHCILHVSVCCLVLNSAVHCIEFCCALLCSVLCCVVEYSGLYGIVLSFIDLSCIVLLCVLRCVVFYFIVVFFLGENIRFWHQSRVICKLSPAWSPRNAPSAVWGLPNMARWRSTWTPRWQRTTRPGTAAGCSKSCCAILSKFNFRTWEHQTTCEASWKHEIIQCRTQEKEEHQKKIQQVGSTDIYSWVSLKVGYPKFQIIIMCLLLKWPFGYIPYETNPVRRRDHRTSGPQSRALYTLSISPDCLACG